MIQTNIAAPATRSHLVRIFLSVAFLLIVIGFIFLQRAELHSVDQALQSGHWYWLSLAVVLEAIYFLLESLYYARTLALEGVAIRPLQVTPILLGAQVLGIIVPSEFLATQSLFLRYTKHSRHSATQVILGTFMAQLAEFFSFLVILLNGFFLLLAHGKIESFEIVAGYTILILGIFLGGMTAVVVWHPESIPTALQFIQTSLNRLSRLVRSAWRIDDSWVKEFADEVTGAITIAKRSPKEFIRTLLLALLAHVVRIICLAAVLYAFGLPVALWQLIAAYSVGNLVWIVSPLPQGIGLVEGAYSLVLISFGFNPAIAFTVSLAYRGIIFWIPLLMGAISLRAFPPQKEIRSDTEHVITHS